VIVETFLRGCKDEGAARYALDMELHTIQKALKHVKTALANDRLLFGERSNAYYHRQVTMQDETTKTTSAESLVTLQKQIQNRTKAIQTMKTKVDMPNRC
jgi:hypothetical protein